MNAPWWSRARSAGVAPAIENGQPRLLPGGREKLIASLAARIGAYVPEWRNQSADDAGVALVKLFGEQLGPVLTRVERLPEKTLVELLGTAGIELQAASPATVLLQFTAADNATASVQVPAGYRVSSPPADDSQNDVTWELERGLAVTPATLAEAFVDERGVARQVDVSGAVPFQPFGPEPQPGSALLLGLEASHDPSPTLSLGLLRNVDQRTPDPVSAGGEVLAGAPLPLIRWEALVGGRFQPLEVVSDGTQGLQTSGVLELRLPRSWGADRPRSAGAGDPLRWLRVLLLHGHFNVAPEFDFIALNLVAARAVRTVRDEFPLPVGGGGPKRVQLSQRPVLPESVELFVDEGAAAAPDTSDANRDDAGDLAQLLQVDSDTSMSASLDDDGFRRWAEVSSLLGQGGTARVFELDPASGVITFGDGEQGMALPDGLRHVVARRYQVSSGRAGAVEAGAVKRLLTTIPFLQSVSNPLPASGGRDVELISAAVMRGPQELKARGRAVTRDDASLLAREAGGADIARTFALSGVDPSRGSSAQAGVIALIVLPNRRPGEQSAEPPVPTAQTLWAAANYIATDVGPLGARVVAAAPRFHRIRIEATVALAPSADVAESVELVLQAIDRYLDPYTGGDDGTGWPLGASLLYARLIRQILAASPDVRSISFLSIVKDGIRHDNCEDVPLSRTGLIWPAGHEIVAVAEEQPA